MVLAHELDDFTMKEAKKFSKMFPRFIYIYFVLHHIKIKIFLGHIVYISITVSLNTTNPYLEANYTIPTFSQCLL